MTIRQLDLSAVLFSPNPSSKLLPSPIPIIAKHDLTAITNDNQTLISSGADRRRPISPYSAALTNSIIFLSQFIFRKVLTVPSQSGLLVLCADNGSIITYSRTAQSIMNHFYTFHHLHSTVKCSTQACSLPPGTAGTHFL